MLRLTYRMDSVHFMFQTYPYYPSTIVSLKTGCLDLSNHNNYLPTPKSKKTKTKQNKIPHKNIT